MRRLRKPVSCAGSGLSWCDLDVTGLDATGLAVPGARGQAGDSDAASRTHAPRSRRNRIMQESNHTSILRVERLQEPRRTFQVVDGELDVDHAQGSVGENGGDGGDVAGSRTHFPLDHE